MTKFIEQQKNQTPDSRKIRAISV